MRQILIGLLTLLIACTPASKKPSQKLKALIIQGQNNHYVWPKTTQMMKSYLEETDLFEVDIVTMKPVWAGIKYNESRPETKDAFLKEFTQISIQDTIPDPPEETEFDADFSNYDIVIPNVGLYTSHWPDKTQKKFEEYMKNGGGLVIVHAANNAWGEWDEYNKMIGLGAWDRDSVSGSYYYYQNNELIKDSTPGLCGSHGPEHEYMIETRDSDHPIMKGIPPKWMHTVDELYDRMRGPGENMNILATAFSHIEKNNPSWELHKGTGRHEPTIMTINYDEGRVFHTTIGHFDYSQECVGFITTFQRGAEWVATGQVTIPVPSDFPTEVESSSRPWANEME